MQSLINWGRMTINSRFCGQAQNWLSNRICHCRLEKTGEFNRFNEESKQDCWENLGILNCLSWENFQIHSASSVFEILTWGINFLLMWCIHHAVAATEKKNLFSILRLCLSHISSWGLITQEAQNRAKASGNTTTGKRRDTSTTPLNSDGKALTKYRASQTFHRWAGENGRYLDHLTPIDMSYVATWKQRSRFENSLILCINDGPRPGPFRRRNEFPQASSTNLQLLNVDKDESFPISFEDSKSGTVIFNERLRPDLERQSRNWNVHWSHASSSSSTDWRTVRKMARKTTKRMATTGSVNHSVSFQNTFSCARIVENS